MLKHKTDKHKLHYYNIKFLAQYNSNYPYAGYADRLSPAG